MSLFVLAKHQLPRMLGEIIIKIDLRKLKLNNKFDNILFIL